MRLRLATLALIAVSFGASPAVAQRHADLVYLQKARQKAQGTASAKTGQEQAVNTPAPAGPTKPATGQSSGQSSNSGR